jgi:hypothetical protein
VQVNMGQVPLYYCVNCQTHGAWDSRQVPQPIRRVKQNDEYEHYI